jgi:hypothetical protein
MSRPSFWGGEEEIRAVSDVFNVRIEVFTDELKILCYGAANEQVVRIAYLNRSHYMALYRGAPPHHPAPVKPMRDHPLPASRVSRAVPFASSEGSSDSSSASGDATGEDDSYACDLEVDEAETSGRGVEEREQAPIIEDPAAEKDKALRDVCTKMHVEECIYKLLRLQHPDLTAASWIAGRRKMDQLFLGDMPYSAASEFPLNPLRFWRHVWIHNEDPVLAPLALRLLALPASEAVCERCFSYLRRIWNGQSRRLTVRNSERRLQAKLGMLLNRDSAKPR